MSDLLEELMNQRGPCLSTELTAWLVDEHGLTAEAARKRVSRGFPSLKRLAYLPFPRRARFLYLQGQYRSPEYWKALQKAIITSNSAYSPALASLIQRRGIIPKAHFAIACGAPIRQKKHLSPETILTRLKQANVVDEIDVPSVGLCITYAEYSDYLDDISFLKARLVTEGILLKAIRMWARNLGLVSFEKVMVRDESEAVPKVGTFAWDLTGPSYLAPMVQWGKGEKPAPGFIACDVLLGSTVTDDGLSPFIHKCLTLRNLKKVGRCLPVFVAENYSKEAFLKAKSIGAVPATPESLFGTEVAEGLAQLTEVLIFAAKACTKPEVFDVMFQRLGKIEGAATNLRGALFEYLVAELVRQTISTNVMLNKIFRDETGKEAAEVDVLAVEGKRAIYFIECKGYQLSGTIKDDDVERWLTKRIPLIRQKALNHPEWKSLEMHFEFWTTGRLSEAAEAKVIAAKTKTRKYFIEYRDATGVLDYALKTKDKALITTLNQHFLEHPLAKAELEAKLQADRQERADQRRLLREVVVVYPDAVQDGLEKEVLITVEVEAEPCPGFVDVSASTPPWAR